MKIESSEHVLTALYFNEQSFVICGLVDARISVSEKDLPVFITKTGHKTNKRKKNQNS